MRLLFVFYMFFTSTSLELLLSVSYVETYLM